jgi:excisionase family DNA binding protein
MVMEVSGMNASLQDVLTLEEVAKYLRLPKETIERQAAQGKIPGRRIEDIWRFLKKAIDHWLQNKVREHEGEILEKWHEYFND